MINELILAWQDPKKRQWMAVGRLKIVNEKFHFHYTQEAKEAEAKKRFMPFGQMTDLEMNYESEELFPLFKNRLLQKSRPEYSDYLKWIDLKDETNHPFFELSRTGGIRATDSLQLFPIPEKKDGNYEIYFFSHGIRYLSKDTLRRIPSLKDNEQLFLMKDFQNKYDPEAILLRTNDPIVAVGYCPKFLTQEFSRLMELNGPENLKATVVKINPDSPFQFKLLCKITTVWPDGFEPFLS